MDASQIKQDKIGPLAELDAADFISESQSPGSGPGCHPQCSEGGKGLGPAESLLKQSGGPHLSKHIQPVITSGAVGAQRYRDAEVDHFGYAGDTRCQLEVRRRTMGYVGPGAAQNIKLRVVDVDTVSQHYAGAGEAQVIQVNDVAFAGFAFNKLNFL